MTYFEETSDNSSESDSEFDEDDDPDKIEVPGKIIFHLHFTFDYR